MKTIAFLLLLLAGLPSYLSAQYTPHQFSELRGMDDSAGTTHLLYRILYGSKSYSTGDEYQNNSVYHFNTMNTSDTLMFRDYYQYFVSIGEYQEVPDYQFWHNDPSLYIISKNIGCVGGIVKRFDTEDIFTHGAIYKLGISAFDDSVVISNIGKSTDGGRNFPQQASFPFYSVSPYNPNIIFFEDLGNLVKSTDGGLNRYIVENSHMWSNKNNFVFDGDSLHIYAAAKSLSAPDYNWQFMVSNSKGDSGSWSSTFTGTGTGKIYIAHDPHSPGKLYLGNFNKVYYSSNFGSTFTAMFTFNKKVTGLYKKPGSAILYIATKDSIYKYDGITLQEIKGIPIDKEMMHYDPIAVGNKWIYNRHEGSLTDTIIYYLEVKEVLKDTVLSDGNKYKKIVSYYFNRNYQSEKTYFYERIDSTTGITYFFKGNQFFSTDELTMDVEGAGSNGSRYGGSPWTNTFTRTSSILLFNKVWDTKSYVSSIAIDAAVSYDLSYSFGITRESSDSYNFSISKYLKGCKIDNKIWGDTSTVVAVKDEVTPPANYSLSQNYPNPFNPSTVIRYSIAAAGNVKITVYDILGRKVADLLNEVKSPGSYEVTFNASALPSGVYFYKLECGGFKEIKKMNFFK